MNRYDFYFEQLVTQADMDDAFDFAELADQRSLADNGYVGIAQGLEVVEAFPTPNLTVDIDVGVAYDQTGQRCGITVAQNLDLSVDSSAVSTAVAGGGNEKWLAVFIAFDRTLSDPRVDGNGVPLQYLRSESFQFIVDQSAEAAAGTQAVYLAGNSETYILGDGMTLDISVDGGMPQTATFNTADFGNIALATAAEVAAVIAGDVVGLTAVDNAGKVELTSASNGPGASLLATGGDTLAIFSFPGTIVVGAGGPARPALRADAILLADVLLRNTTTVINDKPDGGGALGVIDMDTRRESVFEYDTNFNIRAGTIVEFADALAGVLDSHISNTANPHPASAVLFDNEAAQWTPGFSNPVVATEVNAAIHEIIARLTDATSASGSEAGASIVGMDAATITTTWADGTKPTALNVAGTFNDIVTQLADATGPDGAGRIGYEDAVYSPRYGAAVEVAAALDALAVEAARISAVETITGTWNHSGGLTASGGFYATALHETSGQVTRKGADITNTASTAERVVGVTDAYEGKYQFYGQQASGAGNFLMDLEDFGAPTGQTQLAAIRGYVLIWNDTVASVPESTMVHFDFIAGIVNADDDVTTSAGLDTARTLNGGADGYTSTSISAVVATGKCGLDIAFGAGTGIVRNVSVVWSVYRVAKTQA